MDSVMLERRAADELTSSLFQVATDPVQIHSLHRVLGTFCHQGRNILNSMKLSLYLAQRDHPQSVPNFWGELEPGYRSVELFFDRLQTICRPMNLTPLKAPLALLIDDRRESWQAVMMEHRRSLVLVPPPETTVGEFDPVRLGEGLDAFVSWRAKSGCPDTEARLSWKTEEGHFWLEWIEERSDEVFASPIGGEGGPAALSLPLLARVVSAHQGTIDLNVADGLQLQIRWPIVLNHR